MLIVNNEILSTLYPMIEMRAHQHASPNVAPDLVQDTFLRIWQAVTNGKEFNDIDHLRAYATLTLKAATADAWRRDNATNRRGRLVPVEDRDLDYLAGASASAEREVLNDPGTVIEDLSLSLASKGYSHAEITEITGITDPGYAIRKERTRIKRHGLAVA